MLPEHFLLHLDVLRGSIDPAATYPFSLPSIRTLERMAFHPKVTYFVGENGTGKSTLLEAIAVSLGFNPEGGTRNFNFSTRSSHSALSNHIRIAKGLHKPRGGFFLRAESFFNVATEIESLDREEGFGPPIIDSYGGRSLHEQSHGESFTTLLMQGFKGQGIYILDEPESALSPQRQMASLSRIHDLVNDGSQFIIATHSPIMLAYSEATIYQFSAEGISSVRYEDTETFQLMKAFVNNPQGMLRHLLD